MIRRPWGFATSRVFKCSHHLFRVRIKGSATSEKEEAEEEDMAGIHIYRVCERERERESAN